MAACPRLPLDYYNNPLAGSQEQWGMKVRVSTRYDGLWRWLFGVLANVSCWAPDPGRCGERRGIVVRPGCRRHALGHDPGSVEPSILGWLFFYVIDHQHRRWTPMLLQFKTELLAEGIEK